MSEELVKQLRDYAGACRAHGCSCGNCMTCDARNLSPAGADDAADEIERLCAENERISEKHRKGIIGAIVAGDPDWLPSRPNLTGDEALKFHVRDLAGDRKMLSAEVLKLRAENERLTESLANSAAADYELSDEDQDAIARHHSRLSDEVTKVRAENERLRNVQDSVRSLVFEEMSAVKDNTGWRGSRDNFIAFLSKIDAAMGGEGDR